EPRRGGFSPELAVVAGRPAEARGGGSRLIPGGLARTAELVEPVEDGGGVLEPDLRLVGRLELVRGDVLRSLHAAAEPLAHRVVPDDPSGRVRDRGGIARA